jgi:GTP cyclohydrolase I
MITDLPLKEKFANSNEFSFDKTDNDHTSTGLTNLIAEELKLILNTEDSIITIDAKHLCVSSRGIKDDASSTVTSYFGGRFQNQSKILELQNTLNY